MKEEEVQTSVDQEEERAQLNAEIRRLEAALIEAKEVTNIGDAEEEFALRLRESRKDKARLEEELEDQADRARTERRRLNNEIDELEQSLQMARSDLRKARAESPGAGEDNRAELDEAIAERQKTEDTFADARKQHAAEIEDLKGQSRTLEARLVEALERSSNRARSDDTNNTRVELEIETRTQQLRKEAQTALEDSRKEWESERGKLALEIDRLKRAVASPKNDVTPATASAPPQKEAGKKGWLRSKLGSGSDDPASGEAPTSDAVHAQLEKLKKANLSLEERLQGETTAWKAERGKLEAELRKLESALEQSQRTDPDEDKRYKELEARAEASGRASAELKEKLSNLGNESEAARKHLEEKLNTSERARQEIEEKLLAATGKQESEGAELESRAVAAEKTATEAGEKIESLIQEAEAARQDAAEQARTAAAANQELEDKVRLLEKASAQTEKNHQVASAGWEAERTKLQAAIASASEAVTDAASRVDRAELDAVRDELLSQLQQSETARLDLEEELKGKTSAWDEQREELKTEFDRVRQEVESEKEQLEANLRGKLGIEYELKLKDLSLQKESLEQKLRNQPAPETNGGAGDGDLKDEIARVDAQISEVTAFIEDPQAALSNVIRKNVERSELEAYRKGLSYRVGENN